MLTLKKDTYFGCTSRRTSSLARSMDSGRPEIVRRPWKAFHKRMNQPSCLWLVNPWKSVRNHRITNDSGSCFPTSPLSISSLARESSFTWPKFKLHCSNAWTWIQPSTSKKSTVLESSDGLTTPAKNSSNLEGFSQTSILSMVSSSCPWWVPRASLQLISSTSASPAPGAGTAAPSFRTSGSQNTK